MTRTITIDGREITFRASAAIPRMYRLKFRRDIFSDLRDIEKSISGGESLPVTLLTAFENAAYIMAKHADKTQIPQETVEDWLDTFSTFSIYEVFPAIMELWGLNIEQIETPKKK